MLASMLVKVSLGTNDWSEKRNGRRTSMRYHAKERVLQTGQIQWIYEEKDVPLVATNMLLIRVVVGKVTNMEQLVMILRDVPIIQGDRAWNCVTWVKNALEALQSDKKALGTRRIEWIPVRDAAMKYCGDKKNEHRFDGSRGFNMSDVATYDFLEGRETIA